MNVRSLGLSTDLQLLALRGRIVDRSDYLVVTTPDDPAYYYGNLLVLPAAPQIGEVAFWMRRFSEEIGRDPEIKHVTLRWDGTAGEVGARDELVANGFTLEAAEVMTIRARTMPARQSSFAIRPLAADEMQAVADLAFAIGDRHDDVYRLFLQRRSAWKATLVANGSARFWGAFDGSTLIGSLGLVALGDVARFQDVEVATAYRKRGIASALLAAAAAESTCETLVIVAIPGSDAARVYQRAGFRVLEHTASACRYPRANSPLDSYVDAT
jgi:GNAT superfamily N-acetyltransferase